MQYFHKFLRIFVVNLARRSSSTTMLTQWAQGNCGDEVPLTRHFFIRWHKDQAARVFDPLAWSFR